MDLVIYVNGTFEEEQALYDKEKGKIVMKGDYYHDKIGFKIEGYLEAKDISVDVEEIFVYPNEKLFGELGFYNDLD